MSASLYQPTLTPAQGGALANARSPRQALLCDGTGLVTMSFAPAAADFTVHFPRVNPASLPATAFLAGPATSASAFGLKLAAGVPTVVNVSVADLTAASIALRVGVEVALTYTKAGTVGTYYCNGVAVGTITDSQSYTNATAQLGASASANYFTGILAAPIAYNRALSLAEVFALYQQGAPASAADYNTASNTAVNVATTVNDGSAAHDYDTFSGASASAFTAVKSATANESNAYSGTDISLVPGQAVRVSFTCTLTSGTLPVLYLSNTGRSLFSNASAAIVAGANTIVLACTVAGASIRVRFYNAAGDLVNYAISALSITRIGLLVAPDGMQVGAGLQWLDTSGNRAHLLLPTSGVRWSLPDASGQVVIEATVVHSGAGNIQLGGASIIDTSRQWRIVSISANSTAIATVTLGNVSAGAQHVASGALAVGNNARTIVSGAGNFLSTANLWSGSSAAATIRYVIVLSGA